MPEARYDAVADFYATAFDAIDDPASMALLDLIGSPGGLRILDLACGHGRITRELARRGADVTGADMSAALTERQSTRSGRIRSACGTCTPTSARRGGTEAWRLPPSTW